MATQEPISAAQLQAARSQLWHQTGETVLTLEAARDWLAPLGLVLFAPRAQQLGAPAPSLLEATQGATNDAPSLAQAETARTLLARLTGEGSAVPLNLLGGPGDMPDFLATAQVFSFVYTLRGDKLWKQPPATTGANKVTPLAANVYTLLAERGEMTAANLASELGREITESAVARALSELWQHMRVLPLHRQGEGAPLWELATRRFLKTIKAGSNAGQPTALSALVSLYLAQTLLANEDEVAAFLSPLAPRSRIKEVLHALVAARELSELVVEGKTLLHIPGALPAFPELEQPVAAGASAGGEGAEAPASAEDEGRIKRFAPRGGDRERAAFRGKPAAREGGPRKPFGERNGPRPPRREGGASGERERRPFRRDTSEGARPERSAYAKPWNEERRPPRRDSEDAGSADRPRRADERGGDRPFRPKPFGERKPFERRDSAERKPYGERKPFERREPGERKAFGERKSFGGDRKAFGDRKPFGSRPPRDRESGGEERPRRDAGAGDRGDRRPYNREARSLRDGGFRPVRREGAGEENTARPRFRREEGGEGRPPRTGDRKPFGERKPYADRERKPFGERNTFGGDRGRKPAGDRKSFSGGRDRKPFGERDRKPFSGGRDGKPFDRPRRPAGEGEDRPRRSFGDRERPAGDRPARPRREGGTVPFGERNGPPRAGKPFGRPGGGRPGAKRAFSKGPGRGPAKGAAKRPGTRPPRPSGDRGPRKPRRDE